MPTLLLPPRLTDDSVKLWRAAGAAHWQTLRLARWQAPEDLDPADIAVYGGFFIALAETLGISLLEPPVDWLAALPQEFSKRTIRFMPLAAARRCPDRAFYKPSDDKCFLAGIYESGALVDPAAQLPDNLPVLLSDIVSWQIEFRTFALDGKIVALSPYIRNHQRLETADGQFPASDDEFAAAHAFASSVIDACKDSLPPAIVIDVGLLPDRGWAVIEANCAWAAGIYGCDPRAVLPALRRACIPTTDLTPADRRWLTQR
jgi:hypothetical protein